MYLFLLEPVFVFVKLWWEFMKKERKQEIDQESDQEKKNLFYLSLSWPSSGFLTFLFSFINEAAEG